MINDNTYFCVQAWMVTKLKLKGAERDAFAVIYGYCMDGTSEFYGSLRYLGELTGYSRNSMCTALKNLTDKDLLIKTEYEQYNVKCVKYTINFDTVQKIVTGVTENVTENVQKIVTGVTESLLNNIDNNIVKENNINNKYIQENLSQLNNTQSDIVQENNTNSFLGSAKKEKKVSLRDIVNAYTDNKELKEAIWSYVNAFNERCRNENKKGGMLPNVLKGQLKQLDKLSNNNDDEKIDIMYNSVGYYRPYKPASNKSKSYQKFDVTQDCGKSIKYTEEEIKNNAIWEKEIIANGESVDF